MINQVKITDWSDYRDDRSCNGGNYSFSTLYKREGSMYRVTFGTSADFAYCEVCGSFGDHTEDLSWGCYSYNRKSGELKANYKFATEAEVEKDIQRYQNDDNYTVETTSTAV